MISRLEVKVDDALQRIDKISDGNSKAGPVALIKTLLPLQTVADILRFEDRLKTDRQLESELVS